MKEGNKLKQIDVREGARRQHRTISLFAVIQCWQKGIDGLVFKRRHMERLLGLERFKKKRVQWLKEDLEELFPYQETFWSNKKSFSSLFVSRMPLKEFIPRGNMSTERRIKNIAKEGPKIELFRMWERSKPEKIQQLFEGAIPFFADYANYDERLLASYLSLLAQGQISVSSIPPLETEIEQD
jgi:hypothetical protein